MDRPTAVRLIRKLRAVTEDRGASANEARVAAAKASKLEAKYGRVMDTPPRPRPASRVWGQQKQQKPDHVFVGDVFGLRVEPVDFEFDVSTGKASDNVKVHYYRNSSNWKIEIPL